MVIDNFGLYDAYERQQEREARHRPKCDGCREPIWDDTAYRIDDLLLCEDCVERCKVHVEDYEEG